MRSGPRYRYKTNEPFKGSTWHPRIPGEGTTPTRAITLRPRRPERGRRGPCQNRAEDSRKEDHFNKSANSCGAELPLQTILIQDHSLLVRGGDPLLLRRGGPLLVVQQCRKRSAGNNDSSNKEWNMQPLWESYRTKSPCSIGNRPLQ